MANKDAMRRRTSEPSDEEAPPPSPSSSPQHDSESSTQPPGQPPRNDNPDLHPIIDIMRKQQLAKATLTIAIPIALAFLSSRENKLAQSEMTLILVALSVGCAALWNGILLTNTFPRLAQVLESLGIALVFFSFNGVVAFLLPVQFIWVPAVCIGFYVLPFIVAACWQPRPS